MSEELAKKYRPSTLDELVGNKSVVGMLKAKLSNTKKFPHAILLVGPTGCGKTTIARIIANEMECKGMDLKEINFSNQRGIDTVREIEQKMGYRPVEGSSRFFIIDECHKMTNDAQNGFLKPIEEPPKHVYFILCTTQPDKLIPEIKGRCQQYKVEPLSEDDTTILLEKILKKEKITFPKKYFSYIYEATQGHPRNSLNLLDQLLPANEKDILKIIKNYSEDKNYAIDLARALFDRKSNWNTIASILQNLQESDPEIIRRTVLKYATSVILKKESPKAELILSEFIEPTYNSGFAQIVYSCVSIFRG